MREDKLQALLKVVDEEGIQLDYVNFKSSLKIQGLYYKDEGLPPIIGINNSITSNGILHTCVLSEEVGHHFTTTGDLTAEYYSYADKLIVSKEETLALKWATNFLMPYNEIVQAIKDGCTSTYEFADYFGVTEQFFLERIEFLRRQEIYFDNPAFT